MRYGGIDHPSMLLRENVSFIGIVFNILSIFFSDYPLRAFKRFLIPFADNDLPNCKLCAFSKEILV
jgi:hypothetical protein